MPIFNDQARFDMVYYCFKKCVQSFREKPLSPYEKECVYPCLENQASMQIEIHNGHLAYEKFRAMQNNENK